MITTLARSSSNQHVKDAQAVRDVVEGLLYSLTFSVAYAADLAGQVQDGLSVVGTPAAMVVLIALIWSVGRYLVARGDTGRPWLEARRPGRLTRRAGGAGDWCGAEAWVQFMLKDKPNRGARDNPAAFLLTSGSACLLGGLLPLIPYIYLWQLSRTAALVVSVVLTLGALGALGAATAHAAGLSVRRSVAQSLVVGSGLAVIIYVLIVIARLNATA